MEPPDNPIQRVKKPFQLFEHPWLSLLAVMLTTVVAMILASNVIFGWIHLSEYSIMGQFAANMTFHVILSFVLVPFVLRLPKGRSSYRDYLHDIGLTRIRPFFHLVLLGISCYLILAFFQASTSWIYHISHGLPLTWSVIRTSLDISRDLPPESQSLLISFPSIFEEVAFRGILLTVFLGKYSESKSIVFSSIGFSLMHLLNLINGMDPVWVLGQVAGSFIIGLFYGYVFARTRSLLPPMIVHYLGNVFVGTLAGYIQAMAKVEIQVLYGVVLTFGVVPITLMILWTRFFTSRWLPFGTERVVGD